MSDDRLNTAVSRWAPKQMARRALVRCAPRKWLVERIPDSDSIYLTFDDGPHPEYTPYVLDTLAKHDSRATFFVVGEQGERYPELLRRIADEGHTIGNHTYSHLSAREVTSNEFLRDVHRTGEIIRSITGQTCSLFRPPHGALNARTLIGLWRAGQTVVLWNVDPKDYCHSETSVRSWLQRQTLNGGDIVLLHDTQPHTPSVVADVLCNHRSACLKGLGKGA